MLGSGGLISRGGYGGIDPLSNFHGGGGSGGRILIKSCTDNFDGIVDGKGGLTVLPLNYTVLYEKWYNFSDHDLIYNYNVNSKNRNKLLLQAIQDCLVDDFLILIIHYSIVYL